MTIPMTQATAIKLPAAMTQGIIASIRDGILTLDHSGRITSFNPEAQTIFGLNAGRLVGKPYAEAFLVIDGLESFCDAVADTIQHPESRNTVDITITVDGRSKYLNFRGSLLRDGESGASIGLIIVVTDVSERVIHLENMAKREQERSAMGQFMVAMFAVFSVFTLLLEPIQRIAISRLFDAGPFLALGALMVIAFLISRWKEASLGDYGVHLRMSRRDLWDTLLWSAIFCVLMTIGKYLALPSYTGIGGSPAPLFAFFVLDDGTPVDSVGLFAAGLGIYLFSIVFQQLAARSAIQAPLARFLDGTVRAHQWVANLTATLLFAVLHAHLNPMVSLLVIPPSLLWGWLFMRSGGVLAPMLSHTIIGVYGIFILGVFAGMNHV